MTKRFCPTSGESGSILMTKNREGKYEAKGILSFTKSCGTFEFGPGGTGRNWRLYQFSKNPTVYTKLICFLPWIAKQYDLSHNFNEDVDEVNCKS